MKTAQILKFKIDENNSELDVCDFPKCIYAAGFIIKKLIFYLCRFHRANLGHKKRIAFTSYKVGNVNIKDKDKRYCEFVEIGKRGECQKATNFMIKELNNFALCGYHNCKLGGRNTCGGQNCGRISVDRGKEELRWPLCEFHIKDENRERYSG